MTCNYTSSGSGDKKYNKRNGGSNNTGDKEGDSTGD